MADLSNIFSPAGGGGRGVLPYMGYRYVLLQREGFSALSVMNRVSIVAILRITRVRFLNFSLEVRIYFSDFQVINRVGKIAKFGHK